MVIIIITHCWYVYQGMRRCDSHYSCR